MQLEMPGLMLPSGGGETGAARCVEAPRFTYVLRSRPAAALPLTFGRTHATMLALFPQRRAESPGSFGAANQKTHPGLAAKCTGDGRKHSDGEREHRCIAAQVHLQLTAKDVKVWNIFRKGRQKS